MPKSAETYFYEFQTSAETDAAMSLLRSKEAFLYLALMATHLADGQIIDGQTLAALVSEDLATLGPAVRLDPDEPEAMFRKWTRKAWVYRSVVAAEIDLPAGPPVPVRGFLTDQHPPVHRPGGREVHPPALAGQPG
jgi:hypothetical protein